MSLYSKTLFKVASLFAMADGEFSEKDEEFLYDLAKELSLDPSDRWQIIGYCRDLEFLQEEQCSSEVIRLISNALDQSSTSPNFEVDALWTLLNLAYADGKYSEPEKEVIQHLIKRWNTDPRVVAELNDTLDTISLLTQQKIWLTTIGLPASEINSRKTKIDQTIHQLRNDIKTTIHEADKV